ncbi:MAG TPA: large conductance mechanosensitive channel protein MscL [Leptospiraceae bacterium]|nr:large conductance mechanosensitive channel protein MscL [Spirochaetaceae bacterium]HBS05801.1 large conductance mechanosensitive channel protein MscL [Leptospiraceae bacterium]|tara:strand:+ start:72212 stop:72676 length:465 start_codon:yes stop_codon:yes gene_type:complete
MRAFIKEFREFAVKGNAVEMAIGIMLGAAFTSVVKSLVADVLMPPLGLMLGGVDFTNLFWVLKHGEIAGPYATLAQAQEVGAVTINYGTFINTILSFLIVAVVLFFVVRGMNSMRRKEEPAAPTTRPCPECRQAISLDATRCPFCTSRVKKETT